MHSVKRPIKGLERDDQAGHSLSLLVDTAPLERDDQAAHCQWIQHLWNEMIRRMGASLASAISLYEVRQDTPKTIPSHILVVGLLQWHLSASPCVRFGHWED